MRQEHVRRQQQQPEHEEAPPEALRSRHAGKCLPVPRVAQVRRSVTSSSGLLCPRCPIPFTTVGWLRSCRLGGVRDDGADLTHNAVHTYQLKVHANAQVLTFDPQGTLRADRNNKTVVLKPFAFATAITGTVRRRGRPHRRGVLQPKTPSASSGSSIRHLGAFRMVGGT